MILLSLLLIPLFGTILISLFSNNSANLPIKNNTNKNLEDNAVSKLLNISFTQKTAKIISLSTSVLNLAVSLVVFILFDFSFNQFQFVQEPHMISGYNLYLGVDGISIYFVLLTTIIVPIALLSN
jgi:NADH:ubiquinone oxidoreductase subunit 4 (subunit M)